MKEKNNQKNMKNQIIIINKKINFNYYIEKKYEAGIILKGWEVKSLREKKVQIIESYIKIKKNKFYITESIINPLIFNCAFTNINPKRERELLLHKKEMIYINSYIKKKGYNIIPTKIYFKNHLIKVEIAIVIGKKLYDKKKNKKEKELIKEKLTYLKNM
ncbi:MAG TPA: SsrA-binding protein SmpB [Candidatus Azosocius sp. HAIN]